MATRGLCGNPCTRAGMHPAAVAALPQMARPARGEPGPASCPPGRQQPMRLQVSLGDQVGQPQVPSQLYAHVFAGQLCEQ